MDLIKNWKLHLLALLIVIVAESIGMKRFDLIIFLPLFYALIIGGIISYPNFKILKLPRWSVLPVFFPWACSFW